MKKLLSLLLILQLALQISAQTSTDVVSIFGSNIRSLFSSYTSVLGESSTIAGNPLPTTDNNPAASSFGQTSFFESDTSTATSGTTRSRSTRSRTASPITSSVTPLSVTSSASQTGSSSATSGTTATSQSGSTAASTATSSSSPSATSGSGGHNHTLAIVLGTVLGALALGLLLLLILFFCRRRRRRNRRAVAQNESFSSTSDEALTGRRAPFSRAAPAPAALGSRGPGHLDRRNNAGMPLMSERTNYDVPAAHDFQRDRTSMPFVPGPNDPKRSSAALSSGTRDGLGSYGRLHDSSGLTSHPYEDDHHTGSALAGAAGGAALGAAAASARRHSRSSERRPRGRTSEEREVHPAFWDEPPPRSPHRSSHESARRRSGSASRDRFYGQTEQASMPLRGGTRGVTDEAAAMASPTSTYDAGRQSYESGPNNFPSALRSSDQSYGPEFMAASNLTDRSPYTKPNSPRETFAPPTARKDVSTPPALTVQTPSTRSDLPSQKMRRVHLPSGQTQYETIPYQSPQSASSHQPNISISRYDRDQLGSPWSDDLVSPVSPEDTAKGRGQRASLSPGKANLGDVSRSRSVSPQEPGNTLNVPGAISPSSTISRSPGGLGRESSQQRSGLLHAVQGQFGRDDNVDSYSPSRPHAESDEYNPYSPDSGAAAASTFSSNHNNNNNGRASNRPLSKPITRKPVPLSQYNNVQSPTEQPPTNTDSRRDKWRRN